MNIKHEYIYKMKEGKQLSMDKRLYEAQIMKKALLKELDTLFINIEYLQSNIEGIYGYIEEGSKDQTFWRKLGDKLASSKFYFLSSTFVVAKDIDELSGRTLDQHFETNRPKDSYISNPVRTKKLLFILKNFKESAIEKPQGYKKYKSKKFDEYYGYFIEKIDESIKMLEKYVV